MVILQVPYSQGLTRATSYPREFHSLPTALLPIPRPIRLYPYFKSFQPCCLAWQHIHMYNSMWPPGVCPLQKTNNFGHAMTARHTSLFAVLFLPLFLPLWTLQRCSVDLNWLCLRCLSLWLQPSDLTIWDLGFLICRMVTMMPPYDKRRPFTIFVPYLLIVPAPWRLCSENGLALWVITSPHVQHGEAQ